MVATAGPMIIPATKLVAMFRPEVEVEARLLSWSRQVSLVNVFPGMGHNLLSVTDCSATFKLGFFCDNNHDDSMLISKLDVIVPS